MKNFKSHIICLLLLSLLGTGLVACGDSTSSSSATAQQQPDNIAPDTGTVTARIFDSATGEPVANAVISAGKINATTNATGDVTLQGMPAGRIILKVNTPGYAEQSTVINLKSGESFTGLNLQIIPLRFAGTVSAITGGVVTLAGSTARLAITANSLVRADGNPIVGAVTVHMALIDTAQDVKRMPGDLAIMENGQRRPLESFGALTVKLADEAGSEVILKNQSTANLRIPLMTKNDKPPASVPLYYYNNTLGYWVVDPNQALTLQEEAGEWYYTGTINRFDTINADIPYQTINVSGCLQNEAGNRLKNATVLLEGIDYSGYSTVTTNSNGDFVIPARTNSQVIIGGQQGLLFSNTVKIATSTTDTTAGTGCLSVTNAASNVKIRLTWGALPEDVDSHLVTPSGDHISYIDTGDLLQLPFANLDVDDIDGDGPEIITIRRLMVGTYRYMVNNYSETTNPSMTASPIRVELMTPHGTQIFVPNAGEANNNGYSYDWHSFNLKVDEQCNITVEPVRKWLTGIEASLIYNPATTNPVYCSSRN